MAFFEVFVKRKEYKITGYSKEELPMSPDPTQVMIEIDILDISDISEYTMDFSMRCHLKHWYQDLRLKVKIISSHFLRSMCTELFIRKQKAVCKGLYEGFGHYSRINCFLS